MLHLVILLLASSGVTLCSHIDREYYLINMAKSWDEAQRYCRETYMDLVTFGHRDELKRCTDIAKASGVSGNTWSGLKRGVVSSWLWSQTSHGLPVYTNWARAPDPSHHCGSMREDGQWFSELCETPLPFICQDDTSSSGLNVVQQEKSWRLAQEHCRQNAVDLASVRSQTENQEFKKMLDTFKKFSSFWIGLFRDEWKWSDQSDSSFRNWGKTQPNNDGLCATMRLSDKNWFDRSCTSRYPFYCYVAKGARKLKIVRVEMKLNSFLDFSDSAVSEAILNQIKQKYDIKLQWRVQPDENIFHKKEKKKIKEAC